MESPRKKLGAAVLGASLVLGGAAGAYALTGAASAQDSTTTTAPASAAPSPSSTPSTHAPSGQPPAGGPSQSGRPDQPPAGPHVANGITETPLSGSELEQATAAAKKAVSGGTVDRAETDADGAKYEVHMRTSDGSMVTVKLDASFDVTSTENGF